MFNFNKLLKISASIILICSINNLIANYKTTQKQYIEAANYVQNKFYKTDSMLMHTVIGYVYNMYLQPIDSVKITNTKYNINAFTHIDGMFVLMLPDDIINETITLEFYHQNYIIHDTVIILSEALKKVEPLKILLVFASDINTEQFRNTSLCIQPLTSIVHMKKRKRWKIFQRGND